MQACDGVGSGLIIFRRARTWQSELYDHVVNAMGFNDYPAPEVKSLGPDDVYSILLDPSRTFDDFGEPEFTSLADTVSQAVNYYIKHGTLGEYTHLTLQKEK